MKPQELRIGNYVEYFGKIRQIDTIKRCSNGSFAVEICEKRPSGCSWCEYAPIETPSLKPIPLTEEWLLRFGFLRQHDGLVFYKNGHFIEPNNTVNLFDFYTGDYGDWYVTIEHVHQLQNLYFALTGEELTIKNN
jgi:hypothetical protein